MYNIYIYIGFYFLKYILRFRSTRSRRPRRSRQGRNPRFGGSGNCLGKCFRKCLGSCLGSWGRMDFSISLTLFWSGNREILPCTGTQVVRKCIWLQIYPTISNIFSLSRRKRRLFETAAMAGASPGSSHYAASKRQKSHHRASGPSHTQKLFKLRHSAPVWSRTRCTGFDLWRKDRKTRWEPDGSKPSAENLSLFFTKYTWPGRSQKPFTPHPQQGSPVYWREEGMQSPWSQPWRLAWHRCKTHGECSGAFSRNGLSYRHLG